MFIGKTNMHEFAFGITTISSLGGQTLNPYDLMRKPGGSSGGTGAAVAANFACLRHGLRHVRIDPYSFVSQQPRRPAGHAGAVQPRWDHSAGAHAGHRRPLARTVEGIVDRPRPDRGLRSERPRHRGERAAHAVGPTRIPQTGRAGAPGSAF